jgi:hypothetical protein
MFGTLMFCALVTILRKSKENTWKILFLQIEPQEASIRIASQSSEESIDHRVSS